MILSIGEILADMIGNYQNGALTFESHCGGAPFNCAYFAKQAGAKVGFMGCVGKDPVGNFVISEATKAKLDLLQIQTDAQRNTTIAFVTLKDGERDFAFYRHDTADYHIQLQPHYLDGVSIVHIGSLMLSEKEGRTLANRIIKDAKKKKVLISFDVNYRQDIYKDEQDAMSKYLEVIKKADIIKLSEDEYELFSKDETFLNLIQKKKEDTLIVITKGEKGSTCFYKELMITVPAKKLVPIDTTGAGDAFFGTFLALVDGKEWSEKTITTALKEANKKGGEATQYKGALPL